VSGFDLFGDVTTIDTGERSDFDFYETPGFMTRSLLHFHPAIRGYRVLEPCSGRDAIATILRQADCDVLTNDFDVRQPAQTHFDATTREYWQHHAPAVDYVITNPPFNRAIDIVRLAVEHANVGVILLLRKTFLEPTEDRGPWLQAHPPTRVIGEPRYDFRRNGNTDSVSCDWMIWERWPNAALQPFVIDYVAERRTR
jgi:hypothetical protein